MTALLLLTLTIGYGDNSDLPAAFETGTIATAKPKPIVSPILKVLSGYPIRPKSTWWTGCSDWTHLANGKHVGKFPIEWLQTLSNAEVQSLHSDDHENKVNWDYVPGRSTKATQTENVDAIAPIPTVIYNSPIQSNCPNGNCPPSQFQRPGLIFGRSR